jgi:hypothetical protein
LNYCPRAHGEDNGCGPGCDITARLPLAIGVLYFGNKFAYLEKKPDYKDYFQLTNTEMLRFSENTFQKGWYIWDSDNDGLAVTLEIAGDADGDGLENKIDTDSINIGINDYDELKWPGIHLW